MRTIEQLEEDDALFFTTNGSNKVVFASVSDTLAFCIVASDYLRARRRRYPLAYSEGPLLFIDDNTTFNLANRTSFEHNLTSFYPTVGGDLSCIFMWDYSREYLEND